MILVNFVGGFHRAPEWFRHHDHYMTYADTIAPIFVFVAGMGFRLSILRNVGTRGLKAALIAGAKRYAILTLIGIIYASPLDWRDWWDALVDIGLSGLLALPFMVFGTVPRIAAAVGYLAIYQLLFTYGGYGAWTVTHTFGGGPLGPLSWVFCLLFGTIAYDLIASRNARKIIIGCLAWGILLSAAGWAFRAEWPGIKVFWPFSQKAMSLPYPVYATGFAFLCYLPFYLLADLKRIELPTLTVLGANPLVIYLLHVTYLDIHGTIVSEESRLAVALVAFAGLYLGCYAVAKYLYKNKMFIKI